MSASPDAIAAAAARRSEQEWRFWAAKELRRLRCERYGWMCLMFVMSALAGIGTIAITIPAINLSNIAGNLIVLLGIFGGIFNANLVGSNVYWERRCGDAAREREHQLWLLNTGHLSAIEYLAYQSKPTK